MPHPARTQLLITPQKLTSLNYITKASSNSYRWDGDDVGPLDTSSSLLLTSLIKWWSAGQCSYKVVKKTKHKLAMEHTHTVSSQPQQIIQTFLNNCKQNTGSCTYPLSIFDWRGKLQDFMFRVWLKYIGKCWSHSKNKHFRQPSTI